MPGADSLPLALFTNGYRITKLVDSYDPKLIEAKEQASRAAKARIRASAKGADAQAAEARERLKTRR